MSTGRFRNDIIAAGVNGVETPVGKLAGSPATPYSTWLERMQRTRGRHAAITKNLYTWSSYKNWTEKMRENWVDPAAVKPRGDGRPR